MHKCELTPKAALFPTAPGVGAARPLISVTFSQAQGSDLGAGGTPRCQADGQRPQPAHTQLLPPACLSLGVRAPDHCPGAGVLDGYKTMLPRHLGGEGGVCSATRQRNRGPGHTHGKAVSLALPESRRRNLCGGLAAAERCPTPWALPASRVRGLLADHVPSHPAPTSPGPCPRCPLPPTPGTCHSTERGHPWPENGGGVGPGTGWTPVGLGAWGWVEGVVPTKETGKGGAGSPRSARLAVPRPHTPSASPPPWEI